MASLKRYLHLYVLICVLIISSVQVLAAPSGWVLQPVVSPATVVGDAITIPSPAFPAPCGKVIYSYAPAFTLGSLPDLTFDLNVATFISANSIYANIYLDVPPLGVFPTGRFYDVRLDYTYAISNGAIQVSTLAVSGGSAIRQVANNAPTPNTVTNGYTLTQAKSDYPSASFNVTINFGDTARLGYGLTATFVGAALGSTSGSTASGENTRYAFLDGRIDRYSAVAPVAVYPYEDGQGGRGLVLYRITDGVGSLALIVTSDEIAAVGNMPDVPTKISGEGDLLVYRFSHGAFQVTAPYGKGQTYTLEFFDIPLYPNPTEYTATVR